MRLRIVSDGSGKTTRVETLDGELIERVQHVSWECDANGYATVKLTVRAVPVEVVGDASFTPPTAEGWPHRTPSWACQNCGHALTSHGPACAYCDCAHAQLRPDRSDDD